VGALSFVKAEMIIPPRSLVVGNPAKIIKKVSDQMIAWKTAGTQLYQKLPADCHKTLEEVKPLRQVPKNRPVQPDFYQTLAELKSKNDEQ
jgi:phenylacetic acid degradation protein